ncbi:glutaredoxin-like protein [Brevibacterium casei]|uniref:Glutaredoxin-like protein n=3 Tax=Brevibacterium casei TaxID=33889 RepID=A0A449D0F0_9MICO|nr:MULTISPECIES: glutaredoxin domain-containing protein [Brevibacterium]MCM1013165.1 NrdH-redoxin [Brevibacterium sp. XM4083]QPS34570.1 NrdH-redoxin [Brevibacterium casei]VEW10912.1 glutaredoxin-like protein [Brevibacterium casei]
MAENTITMYGAEWCGDCRRTKKQLTELGIDFDYIDLVAEPERADDAKAISGRTNIPVVVYPDGSHQVEPTNTEVEDKLKDLALL